MCRARCLKQFFYQTWRFKNARSFSSGVKDTGSSPCRVFSGIQPTGVPHLGNYVGAIRNWVQLQEKYETVLFSIVDLHSITLPQDPAVLRENIYTMTASLLASGIDPQKCILFQQSSVPDHTELSWILGCLCTIPRLQHLPQWKEKSKTTNEQSVGLFTYPVLQSADILLYKATDVPVGEDQIHHIELARDLAKGFNRRFGQVFPQPTAATGDNTRIKSLKNPENKMSKSEESANGRIELTDSPDEVHKKIKKSMTDVIAEITYDPKERPGISNLIDIHSALTGLSTNQIVAESAGMNKVQYKSKLTDVVNETIQPIRTEILRLQDDRSYLQSVLEIGREKAASISRVTMDDVKTRVGFR